MNPESLITPQTLRARLISDLAHRVDALINERNAGLVNDEDFLTFLKMYSDRGQSIRNDQHHITPARPHITEEWKQYASSTAVIDFCAKHNIKLDTKSYWWWMKEDRIATLPGLDRITGRPRITNGVLCYLEREDGTAHECHLDWLRYYPRPKAQVERKKSTATAVKDAIAKGGTREEMNKRVLESLGIAAVAMVEAETK